MYSDNPSLANRSAVAGFLDPGGRVSGTAAQQPTNPYDHPKNKKDYGIDAKGTGIYILAEIQKSRYIN